MQDRSRLAGHTKPSRSRARADALLHAGRYREAITAYRDLLADEPRDADVWFNLGYLFRHSGEPTHALAAYRNALSHGISAPEEVHLNCAALLSDHLRDYTAARIELELALSVAPTYPPAWLNLGNLCEEQGDRDGAISAYRQLVAARKPEVGETYSLEALGRLLHLAPPSTLQDSTLLELESMTSRARYGMPLDATLRFALGRAHDRLGAYASAFAMFDAANALAHENAPTYLAKNAEHATSALHAVFSEPSEISGTRPWVPPLFICGMFRSGSTLLEHTLGAHPDIATAGEIDLLPRLVQSRIPNFPAALPEATSTFYESLGFAYIEARDPIAHTQPNTRYVTDKRLENIAYVGLIKRMFPDAKIIHTRRHPMATGLSVFMQHINPERFSYAGRLADIGHQIGEQYRLMRHWCTLYPADIHVFDYDAFVRHPEPTLRALLDFLELPWHEACLDFHQSSHVVKTASYWQVREPLHQRASQHWRNYASWLGPLADALEVAGLNELVDSPTDASGSYSRST